MLNHVGIKCSIAEAINISPSRTSLENYVADLAVDQTLVAAEEIKRAPTVYLGSDVGQKGACITKLFYWCDGAPKEYMLDANSKGKSSEDIGNGTIASVKKIRMDRQFWLFGVTTDSGGGGTLESGASVLQDGELAADDAGFLINSCTLHNLNLCLVTPTKEYLGEGGVDVRTALQLYHSIYYLQDLIGDLLKEYFKLSWDKLNPDVPFPNELQVSLQEPVMTRWWSVFVAAHFCRRYWDIIRYTVTIIAACTRTDDVHNKVASNICSLTDVFRVIWPNLADF